MSTQNLWVKRPNLEGKKSKFCDEKSDFEISRSKL